MPKNGNFEAMIGNTYGRLEVTAISDKRQHNKTHLDVRCSCGKVLTVQSVSVKSGLTQSCGCLKVEKLKSFAWPFNPKKR